MRAFAKLLLARLWLPLALPLLSPGCLFFDDTVYCDTAADCPDGQSCDVELGTCKAGAPGSDAGPLPDAGPRPDAGDVDAGDDDAGPGDDDGGTRPDDAGTDAGFEPPTAPGIALLPEGPRTLDDLYVEIVDESEASAPVSYRYAWWRDGVSQADLTGERVPAARTAKAQTWRVVVTPVANDVEGAPSEAEVTIQNTPPTLRGVALYPLRPTVGDTLEAVPVGYYDPDEGDPRSVELRWFDATTGSTNPLQQGATTTFAASALNATSGTAAVRVVAIPRDSAVAGAAGPPVSSCDRTVSTKPTWHLEHPVSAGGDLIAGGQYLHLDEANDRVLLGLVHGRDLYGAHELSLAAPSRGWSLVDLRGDAIRMWAAQVWIPSRGAYLQVGGLAFDGGSANLTADGLWLDLTHGCEAFAPETLPPGPAGRMGSAAHFDPSADRAVLLLGATHDGVDYVGSDEVWALSLAGDELAYTQLSPTGTAPSGRVLAFTDYDPVEHQVVLYGGIDATNIEASVALSDVYALSLDEGAEAWRAIAPSGSGPGARRFAGVSVHAERHELLVFGGCDQEATCTTSWHADGYRLSLAPGGETWAPLELAGDPLPGPILDMVADRDRGTFYLLALDTADPTKHAFQLLELVPPDDDDGAFTLHKRWSQLEQVPPPRSRFALVGPSAQRDDLLAIYGGRYNGYAPDERARDDVWRFSLSSGRWSEMQQGGPRPSPRHSFAWAAGEHSMTAASPGGLPLTLFGGRCETGPGTFETCGGTHAVERYDENTVFWKLYNGTVGLPPATFESAGLLSRAGISGRTLRVVGGRDASHAPTGASSSFRVELGTGSFENGSWESDDFTAPALAGAAAAVSPSSFEDLAYLFGGLDALGDASDTLYVGSAVGDWAFEVVSPTDGVSPPARAGATLTHVGRGQFVLFGGEAPFADVPSDVWVLDCDDVGTPVSCRWVSLDIPPERAPRPRAFHGAAYDAARDRLWVFGGDVFGEPVAETWSFGPLRLVLGEP